jgi:hypothetical protein
MLPHANIGMKKCSQEQIKDRQGYEDRKQERGTVNYTQGHVHRHYPSKETSPLQYSNTRHPGITLTSKLQTGHSHRQANPEIEGD